MNTKRNGRFFLIIFGLILLHPEVGFSLIIVGRREPVRDHGWPIGSVEMAHLPTRVSWWAGPPSGIGSMHEFEYQCDNTDAFNQALETFAVIDANSLELIVHNGPKQSIHEKDREKSKPENHIDWTFTVWDTERWNKLYNNPDSLSRSGNPNFRKPIASPRVDVYIGGGAVVWEEVKVPKNLVVIDKRPGTISVEFAGNGLIHGKVYDVATGRPIVGAEIALAKRKGGRKWEEVITGKTDDQGFCQIVKIPLNYYEVRIRSEGYVSRKQGSYNNKRPEYYQFEVGLARPSYIKGLVTDTAGKPIANVKVSARNVIGTDGFAYVSLQKTSAITNEQGQFEIYGLPIGFTNIKCYVDSLHMTNSIFEVYPVPCDSIRLVMEGTAVIRGNVVDENGKRLLGDIRIFVLPPGERRGKWCGSTICEEDGSFEFTGIPPGQYLIGTDPRMMIESGKGNTQLISVQADKTYELEIVHK